MTFIKSLEISKLHGENNINLDFFKDINLLYGQNGSGKTTILKIIEILISGNLDELFDYKFKKIVLTGDKIRLRLNYKNEKLLIRLIEKNKLKIELCIYDKKSIFLNRDFRIKDYENLKEEFFEQENSKELLSLQKILKKNFNLLSIPVERSIKTENRITEDKINKYFKKRIRNVNSHKLSTSSDYISKNVRNENIDLYLEDISFRLKEKYLEEVDSYRDSENEKIKGEIFKLLLEYNNEKNYEIESKSKKKKKKEEKEEKEEKEGEE
mgnify:CR=1 FL=1